MSPADTPQARPGQSGGLRQQAAPPGPRRRVVLQCLGYWGEMWGGGPTPVAQRRVTTPAQGHRHQVCRHTHATHACTQLPNTLGAPPTSTRATLLEQACTHAGGILGSGSRTPSPHHRASFQPVGGCQGGEQLVQRCQRHRETGAGGRAGGGEVHPRRAMGTQAHEPCGLGFKQRDGPGPRCWVGHAWESSGWSRSRAEALEGLGHAVTLGAKCGMKCSWPVPKSRRSSGQEKQTATPSSGSECMSHTCEASPGGPRSLT